MEDYLTDLLGGRVTEDWWERVIYGRDLAEMPAIMLKLLKLETIPDLVARPKTAAEVAALVKYAGSKGMAVVPRGGASSAFFNSVPLKKGITLDLCGLSGILELDEERGEANVGAGQRWQELDRQLRQKGWAVKSYPSSAPSATVGGWLNMEGYGIGSLSFGSLSDQISKLEVVLADGTIREITPDTRPAISWFAGSDGTLGIVTKVTLRVHRAPAAESHWLLSFSEGRSLNRAAQVLAEEDPVPYNIAYYNNVYYEYFKKLGYEVPSGEVLAVDYEGDQDILDAAEKSLRNMAGKYDAEVLPPEMGDSEWQERFYHMRIKRLGPTLMAAEDWLPLEKLGEYQAALNRLGHSARTKFYSYGTIVNPKKMTMFAGFCADSRQGLPFMVAMALTARLHHLAIKLGGHPYSVGFWNTPYLPYIYSGTELAEARQRKRLLDPQGLLNPGKHYDHPALLPPWFFLLGTSIASLLQKFTGPREEE
jgi:glycolate oxidase